jgi:ABC-type Fe3+ transport system permease subunit
MMLTSLMGTLSGGVSLENVTLRHFAALFDQQGDALSALGTSLSLALGSALIVGALGLLAAWLVMVQKIKGRGVVDALSLMPAALPGVVVGWVDPAVEPALLAALALQHAVDAAALLLLPAAGRCAMSAARCASSAPILSPPPGSTAHRRCRRCG